MKPYTVLTDLAALLPETPPESILSRTVFTSGPFKAVLFRFAPGQELSEHTASQPAVLHFLEGEADLTLGAEALTARGGTWVHLAARQPHSVRAQTPLVMLLLLLPATD
ncbi:MAG: cupin domain-containing protein [Chloroflexi bacterium]|nr:cupin domain-containing protein [Chloroflexota bacterium]